MNGQTMTKTRVESGIAGLDEVLSGGFVPNRTYLLSGPPGCGKTTLGWHFLTAGVAAGESSMFITFGEPESELRANAEASGFITEGVHFCDLSPSADLFSEMKNYDIFSASEVELEPTTDAIKLAVEEFKPRRIFVDSMTHLRYLSKDQNEFRRQTLSFLRFLVEGGACVMLTSESSPDSRDDDLRFLVDGVIEIEPGIRNRTLRVLKFRGSDFRSGVHTLRLNARGATVYPRLLPERHHVNFAEDKLPWGIAGVDRLLHGGIERGTITLISGPSGVGKSTIGAQFMKEAASRGERSAIYTFDERAQTLLNRATSVNIPVQSMIDHGTLSVVEIEALRFGVDEFANMVRRDVEQNGTRIVMLDSISGYRLSVAGDDITERLHALCKYLQNVGVTVLLVNELTQLNDFRVSDIGISYLADNVVYLRYVEQQRDNVTELGRALGVLKKRLSDFDKTLQEFTITSDGLIVGDAVDALGGILGAPTATRVR